ncbi:adenosylcobinamide-phosphate synthase CbiB [Aestuariivirga litoralis]|uniref:adenosylcobinamide-phosphate synthase CbiB n=1 Tax=Aestuariivirga litoralis TaxID=2650924 RepID=UPI001FEF1B23|nr:adenosylcobinamide-phosphate synthase CbiB [Aestuariivirga litoralis]
MATLALLIESLAGYPRLLQSSIGHPVQWMGKLITFLDEGLNDPDASPASNRLNGVIALVVLILCCALPGMIAAWILASIPYGWVINVLIATTLIAQKSLSDHVGEVERALGNSLPAARLAVGKIVGRDPETLDEKGIAKGALESLAENASDGVVAPALWYAILGLPGLLAYKAINTADSMIGHKSDQYLNFGWASARLDDLVNLPASRLTGLLFAGAARLKGAAPMKAAWAAMWRDAGKHQSPNAGWPEASMAGALGLSFGGPRTYHGELVDLPTMGQGRAPEGPKDIAEGLSLFRNAMTLLMLLGAALAFAL